jgi:hypothetical protein
LRSYSATVYRNNSTGWVVGQQTFCMREAAWTNADRTRCSSALLDRETIGPVDFDPLERTQHSVAPDLAEYRSLPDWLRGQQNELKQVHFDWVSSNHTAHYRQRRRSRRRRTHLRMMFRLKCKHLLFGSAGALSCPCGRRRSFLSSRSRYFVSRPSSQPQISQIQVSLLKGFGFSLQSNASISQRRDLKRACTCMRLPFPGTCASTVRKESSRRHALTTLRANAETFVPTNSGRPTHANCSPALV